MTDAARAAKILDACSHAQGTRLRRMICVECLTLALDAYAAEQTAALREENARLRGALRQARVAANIMHGLEDDPEAVKAALTKLDYGRQQAKTEILLADPRGPAMSDVARATCQHTDIEREVAHAVAGHCLICYLAGQTAAVKREGAMEEAARHADCCVDREQMAALRAMVTELCVDLEQEHLCVLSECEVGEHDKKACETHLLLERARQCL